MRINKLFNLTIIFFAMVLFLSGCLSSIVHVTGVNITGGDQILEVGKNLQLSVEIEPIDSTNTVVFWESSDINKVTVDENGLVEAIASPGADITVITEDGEFEDTIAIIVIPASSDTSNNTCDPCNTNDPCNTCDPDPCNTCDPCSTCEPECDPCNPCGDCYDECECDPASCCDPCDPCGDCYDPDDASCNPCGC